MRVGGTADRGARFAMSAFFTWAVLRLPS